MRLSWRLTITTALVLLTASFARPSLAAGCPTTAVADNGGTHVCFNDSDNGHVHVWKPGNYNKATAANVIYIHGHDIDVDPRERDHYVDESWTLHKLPQQFKASGLNAMFVTIEGPIGNSTSGVSAYHQKVLWTSLSSLMSAIRGKVSDTPTSTDVMALGHSAGMFTMNAWLDENILKHVVTLDSLYPSAEDKPSTINGLYNWFKNGKDRKLTLVGGSATNGQTGRLAAKIPGIIEKAGYPTSFSVDDVAARAVYLNSTTSHMKVVTGQKAIPLALTRSGAPNAASPTGDQAGTTAGTSGSTAPPAPTTINRVSSITPKLQVPIPNVELSNLIVADGQITVPWIAEYMRGIYQFLVSIVGLVAAVMIMVGGLQYLTAGGDTTKVGTAKTRILNALLGMVLVLGAYAILFVINPGLVNFEHLAFMEVSTEIEVRPDVALEGLDPATEATVVEEQKSSGQTPCSTDATCLTYCKSLGCKVVSQTVGGEAKDLCKPEIINGDLAKSEKLRKSGTGTIVSSYCPMKCDEGKIPNSAPGFELFDVNEALKKGGATKIKGGGAKATKRAIEGLLDIEKQLHKPEFESYDIEVSNCFRDYKAGIRIGCVSLIGAERMRQLGDTKLAEKFDANTPSIAAYPGSSPHGFGYACDMVLYQTVNGSRKKLIVIDSKQMCDPVYKARVEKFDEIVFPTGARRYYGEIWHYEWGNPNTGARCGTGVTTACVWPPPPCTKNK